MATPQTQSPQIIRLPYIIHALGRSKSSVWMLIKTDPKFPRKVQLGKRCLGWVRSEIDDYIQNIIDARDNAAA